QILVGVDGDRLFIWLAPDTIIGGNVIRVTFLGRRDPVGRCGCALWMNRNGDDLSWDGRVRLLGRADREVVRAILVVEVLVGQDELIVVPKGIEGPNRVGVIGPAFIPWDMPLGRPGLATVKGLVESKQVVVPLGADEPLGGADQV